MKLCAKEGCGKPVGGLIPRKTKYCTACRAADARPSHLARTKNRRAKQVAAVLSWCAHHRFEVRWGEMYDYKTKEFVKAKFCDGVLRRGLIDNWVKFSVGNVAKRCACLKADSSPEVSTWVYWHAIKCEGWGVKRGYRRRSKKPALLGGKCGCYPCMYERMLNKGYGGRRQQRYVHSIQKEHKWQKEYQEHEEALQRVLPQVELEEE